MVPASLAATLRAALRDRDDVRLAIVFGSRARGTARADSDVDLAVLGPLRDPLALRYDLSEVCGLDVDLVSLDDPGYPLLAAIVRDGIPVREGRRGAFADWRGRAWTTLETDRSWYHRMRDAWLAKLASGA